MSVSSYHDADAAYLRDTDRFVDVSADEAWDELMRAFEQTPLSHRAAFLDEQPDEVRDRIAAAVMAANRVVPAGVAEMDAELRSQQREVA